MFVMPSITFNGKHAFNVEFSPFLTNYMACVTTDKFGLTGGGSLFILENDGSQHLRVRKNFIWPRRLLDVSWSRKQDNIITTSSGDGSLQIWKLFDNTAIHPLKVYREHTGDVSTIDTFENIIASGSWDSTIKIWDAMINSSVTTYRPGLGIIHSVKWARSISHVLVSVSEKANLVLWDTFCPTHYVHKVEMPNVESLDCDWSHSEPYVVTACGSDGLIRWWDVRSLRFPFNTVSDPGEIHAKIKVSPHYPNVVVTSSFSMQTQVWLPTGQRLETIGHHSAFVSGLDFNLSIPGEMADCGLDSDLHVYTPLSLQPLPCLPTIRHKI